MICPWCCRLLAARKSLQLSPRAVPRPRNLVGPRISTRARASSAQQAVAVEDSPHHHHPHIPYYPPGGHFRPPPTPPPDFEMPELQPPPPEVQQPQREAMPPDEEDSVPTSDAPPIALPEPSSSSKIEPSLGAPDPPLLSSPQQPPEDEPPDPPHEEETRTPAQASTKREAPLSPKEYISDRSATTASQVMTSEPPERSPIRYFTSDHKLPTSNPPEPDFPPPMSRTSARSEPPAFGSVPASASALGTPWADDLRFPRPYAPSTGIAPNRLPSTYQNHVQATAQDTITKFKSIQDLRQQRRIARERGRRVGFVPTMGALHEGHLDLIRAAAEQNDEIYVSIFVNPTQFGPNEDLSRYPRQLKTDMNALKQINKALDELQSPVRGRVTGIFTPKAQELYPLGVQAASLVMMYPKITQVLEGAARPTFFQGVTTVVMKLLNIVQPERVYFGQKDIQQLIIVHRMIAEFAIDTRLVLVPTHREESGLAMSSRNQYLGSRRRAVASVLSRALLAAQAVYDRGSRVRSEILDAATSVAVAELEQQRNKPPEERARFEIEYFSLVEPVYLEEIEVVGERGAIISAAMNLLPLEMAQTAEVLGTDNDAHPVRIIDNILLGAAAERFNGQAIHFNKYIGQDQRLLDECG